MKKRVPNALFVKCPFCNYLIETTNSGRWCANCLVEYYITRDEEYIVFDTKRNKFALHRAIQAAGGLAMCKLEKPKK